MRQHVNPLSNNFDEVERIPALIEMFEDSKLPIHLDIGCAAGEFLFDLAFANTNWNYLGIEIRERLVKTAKLKVRNREIKNLYFVFVINCNLQRLDGPVRGNGKIIQELEGIFRGAGWNVINVIWGSYWDPLLANDKTAK